MRYIDQKREAVVVFTGNVARKLLKMGYTIIDIKANKRNKLQTVFVFRNDEGFEKVLADITFKENNEDLFTDE